MRAPGRPRVLVLAPDALFRSFFDAAAAAAAARARSAGRASGARTLDRVACARRCADADALVTTWDSPRFAADAAPRSRPRVRIDRATAGAR